MSDASVVHPDPTAASPIASEAIRLVARWREAAAAVPVDAPTARLQELLADSEALAFAMRFADRVARPDDLRVAARALDRLSRAVPSDLPRRFDIGAQLSGGFALLAPRPVVPLARAAFARMLRPLLLDAPPAKIGAALDRLRRPGLALEVALPAAPAVGPRDAERQVAALADLVGRPEIDHVSLSLSTLEPPSHGWGFDAAVGRLVDGLLPIYRRAADPPRTTITLDAPAYGDLDLTVAVFTRLLDLPELADLEAGITLAGSHPESLDVLQQLTAWARQRVAGGGAGIRVRLSPAAHLAEERADAVVRGWRPPESAEAIDARFVRLLDWAMTPPHADAIRVGVATSDPVLLALAWLLAGHRAVRSRVGFDLRRGIAPAWAEILRAENAAVLVSVPIRSEGDAAAELVRTLQDAHTAVVEDLDEARVAERVHRLAEALELGAEAPPVPRAADRSHPEVPRAPMSFRPEPDTDPAAAANRAWADHILGRALATSLGDATLAEAVVHDADALAELLGDAADAGRAWATSPPTVRADLLDRCGEVLAALRGRLIEVAVAESATVLREADSVASAVVDLAYRGAARARILAGIEDAALEPVEIVVVVPDAIDPLTDTIAGVAAAVAAGNAAIVAPPPAAARSAAVLVEALWEAGVPRRLVRLVRVDDPRLGAALIASPVVGRVVSTADATAPGVNTVIVTPSADPDTAIPGIVRGAFARSGQAADAVSVAILVGSVGTSASFRRRLADAVTALEVGEAVDPASDVGPLLASPTGAVERALTALGPGESWLVRPRLLGEGDRLWTPAIRDGVRPGSPFLSASRVGPVLGLVVAATWAEALEIQRSIGQGRVAVLHSLDPVEVAEWLEQTDAETLVVGRAPGWSTIADTGSEAVYALTRARPVDAEPDGDLRLAGFAPQVRAFVEACQPALDYAGFDRVRRGALSDQRAWDRLGVVRESGTPGVERAAIRYRPAAATVRLGEGGRLEDLVRVLAAGIRAGAPMRVSSAEPLPAGLLPIARDLGISEVAVENDAAFRARIDRDPPRRLRLVGVSVTAVDPDATVEVWDDDVTDAGRLELRPFVREQTVVLVEHRSGVPDPELTAIQL
jgi:RHH-type proline utilization regulon transcriptional repressor/proline dehydrogenase/delta 1-pyrroline-5-carboxylate dehydrogenase